MAIRIAAAVNNIFGCNLQFFSQARAAHPPIFMRKSYDDTDPLFLSNKISSRQRFPDTSATNEIACRDDVQQQPSIVHVTPSLPHAVRLLFKRPHKFTHHTPKTLDVPILYRKQLFAPVRMFLVCGKKTVPVASGRCDQRRFHHDCLFHSLVLYFGR